MAIKVGINGFGRIGRLVFRAAVKNPNVEVGINATPHQPGLHGIYAPNTTASRAVLTAKFPIPMIPSS